MLIYLNDLKDKKRKRLSDYMEDELGGVLDKYLSLLNKKQRKTFLLQGLSDEILFHHLTPQEKYKRGNQHKDEIARMVMYDNTAIRD